ncbi:MAG: DUF5659 domain-containing protein [Patescibacteria group bacterium]
MRTEEDDGFLSCSDIEVASVLLANKHKLLRVDRSTPTRSIFCFQRTPGIEKEIESFYSSDLRVDALAYSNARKNLKSIIYSDQNMH